MAVFAVFSPTFGGRGRNDHLLSEQIKIRVLLYVMRSV